MRGQISIHQMVDWQRPVWIMKIAKKRKKEWKGFWLIDSWLKTHFPMRSSKNIVKKKSFPIICGHLNCRFIDRSHFIFRFRFFFVSCIKYADVEFCSVGCHDFLTHFLVCHSEGVERTNDRIEERRKQNGCEQKTWRRWQNIIPKVLIRKKETELVRCWLHQEWAKFFARFVSFLRLYLGMV